MKTHTSIFAVALLIVGCAGLHADSLTNAPSQIRSGYLVVLPSWSDDFEILAKMRKHGMSCLFFKPAQHDAESWLARLETWRSSGQRRAHGV